MELVCRSLPSGRVDFETLLRRSYPLVISSILRGHSQYRSIEVAKCQVHSASRSISIYRLGREISRVADICWADSL